MNTNVVPPERVVGFSNRPCCGPLTTIERRASAEGKAAIWRGSDRRWWASFELQRGMPSSRWVDYFYDWQSAMNYVSRLHQ